MPRRRKKSMQDRKPPLIFTESPVSIQNNVPSPIECARHPLTATSVPVEQLDNVSWVSPQFSQTGNQTSHRYRNTRQRRMKHPITRRTGNKSVSGSHVESNTKRPSKFGSLKFVGDPSTTGTSDSEEVDIDDADHNDSSMGTSSLCQNNHKVRQRQKFGAIVEEISASFDSNVESHGVTTSDSDDPSNHSNSKESSVTEFTQIRRPSKGKAPVKRLFASQLHLSLDKSAGGFLDSPYLDKENCLSAGCNKVCADFDSEKETIAETESDSDAAASAGLRRSERLKMLRRVLQMSDSPCSDKNANILVPDTPESCYGWSIRKHQLKNYKQKR